MSNPYWRECCKNLWEEDHKMDCHKGLVKTFEDLSEELDGLVDFLQASALRGKLRWAGLYFQKVEL